MKNILLVMLIVLPFPIVVHANDIDVDNIHTKVLSAYESHVVFAIKARLRNSGEDKKVCETLQALDADGFEMSSLELCGEIPPGTAKEITRSSVMPLDYWNRIDRWQRRD